MTSVIVTDNTGCFTKDSIQISTQNTLELSTSSLPISCTTDEGTAVVSVVGGTPNYTYNWSNGGTTSSTQVLVSGTYIVFVTDASGCVSEDSIIVAPANIPISIASSNSSICEGETLNLLATNSPTIGSSYSWTGPNGFISNLQNPLIIPSTILSSGDYILTIMANDCSSISTTSVVIKENPHANFSSNILTGCEPLEVKFTDLSVPISTTVLWNFGDGTTSSSSGIISHIFTSAGDYDISLLSMSSGCSSTITLPQLIHVSANANANFTANPLETIIFEPLINFTNHSTNSNSYSCNFGDNTNSSLFNSQHIYSSEPGNYNIQLIVNNAENCPDTSEIAIKIIEPLIFYVPNSFTPDGDKYNEVFIPVMTSGFDPKSYEMQIYNRWGEKVFETKDISIGWDGKFKGEKVQDGTFTWEITFKDKVTDKKYSYIGHLNLLK